MRIMEAVVKSRTYDLDIESIYIIKPCFFGGLWLQDRHVVSVEV